MHLKNLSGRFSPKKTMSGFTNPPQSSQVGMSSLNISSLIHCWENSFLHLIQWPVWKAPWASTILGKGSFGRKSIYDVYCELKLFFQHFSIIQEGLKIVSKWPLSLSSLTPATLSRVSMFWVKCLSNIPLCSRSLMKWWLGVGSNDPGYSSLASVKKGWGFSWKYLMSNIDVGLGRLYFWRLS